MRLRSRGPRFRKSRELFRPEGARIPCRPMKLSEEQLATIAKAVDRLRCSNCRGRNFEIQDQVLSLAAINDGRFDLQHVAPLVLVVCARCGHADIFSAATLGIV